MKSVVRNLGIAAALVAASAAMAGGSISVGVGLGEYSNGGASDHSTQLTVRGDYHFDSDFELGLRHTQGEYDTQNLEISYTTLLGAYRIYEDEQYQARVGLVAERLEGDNAGVSWTDSAYGLLLGGRFQVAQGVAFVVDAAYLKTDEDDEDIVDVDLRLQFDVSENVVLGLDYWVRQTSDDAPGTNDVDQDAVSLSVGFQF